MFIFKGNNRFLFLFLQLKTDFLKILYLITDFYFIFTIKNRFKKNFVINNRFLFLFLELIPDFDFYNYVNVYN